jgi:hypothetical protein
MTSQDAAPAIQRARESVRRGDLLATVVTTNMKRPRRLRSALQSRSALRRRAGARTGAQTDLLRRAPPDPLGVPECPSAIGTAGLS